MKGYVLACQTEIHDDLEIVIPAESRVEASKIMTGGESGAMGEDGIESHRQEVLSGPFGPLSGRQRSRCGTYIQGTSENPGMAPF